MSRSAWTFFAVTGIATAQQAEIHIQPEIQIQRVRGNVYMLVGAGANIAVSAGRDGVLMVDTGASNMTDPVLGAIRRLQNAAATNGVETLHYGAEGRSSLRAITDTDPPPKPIRYIVNTSLDGDHTGGNEKIAKSGKTFTGGNVAGSLSDAAQGAAILAHENVLRRMSQGKPALAFGALPTDTYHIPSMNLSHYFNGEGVQILHMPAAHTDGDSIVWFRGSDVIATGDVFTPDRYPVIDLAQGGSLQGVIDALNRILEITVPEFRLEGGTMVIPGHGHLCDAADVAYYRDMATIIRDRIQALIKKDMSLDQVKAAKPTLDYDGIYGATAGPWTTTLFIEAAYKSLSGKK